jgi:DnaK suppressor protein
LAHKGEGFHACFDFQKFRCQIFPARWRAATIARRPKYRDGRIKGACQGDRRGQQATDKPENLSFAFVSAAPSKGIGASPLRPGFKQRSQATFQRRAIVKAPANKNPTPAKAAVKPATKTVSKVKATAKVASPVKKKTASPVASKAGTASAKLSTKAASVPSPALAASKKLAVQPVPVKAKVAAKSIQPARPVAQPVAKPLQTPDAKAPSKPVAKDSKIVKSVSPAKTAAASAAAPVPAHNPGLPPPKPLKPGRRSSARVTAQSAPQAPMLPTHSPDAAKASYSAITERVIAPPVHTAAKKDPKLANNWKTKAADELTDDEVKSMPDSEYMNDKQLAFFRHKLSVLKQDIHNSAGKTTEHLREDTVVVPDPADRATIEEEHALELRTRDRERKLLKKIEQSIARIDSGDYGYCDETGEPIGVGRLIARPTANLSLEAQQRRELKQKMFGD